MTHEVFISYSSKDQKIVEGLSAYLEQNGVRCFVAYRDIPRGVVWAAAITAALDDCKLMVVVFSDHFNRSAQVDREIELCVNEGKPILTFKIDAAVFTGAKKYYLQNINWIDAFPDPQACFGELLAAVRKLLPATATQPEHYRINLVKQSDLPVRASEPPPAQPAANPALQNPCILKIRPNADCNVYVDEEFKLKAEANRINRLPLNKGTFWLEFVSAANDADRISREYTLNNPEELLTVDLESVAEVRIKQEQERLEQERLEKLELYPFESSTGKYGYKDENTGDIVIEPMYDKAWNFEGLALVKNRGQWGFIDKTGREIIPLKYDDASHFYEGLARVNKDGKYGFIDKTGREIIPLIYDLAGVFSEGLAVVNKDGKWGFIDKTGREIIPFIYDDAWSFSEGLAKVKKNGKWLTIDKTGKEID